MNKEFILKLDQMMAMSYKGKYGKYDIGMKQTWYDKDGAQWYTCQDENNFYLIVQGSRSGQDNNQDWKDNFNFDQEGYKYNKKIKLHDGFKRQATIVFDEMKEKIEEWYITDKDGYIRSINNNKKLIIGGHSLGGAVAQTLPVFFGHQTFINTKNIIVVTEGAPRSYNKAGSNWFNNNVKNSIRIVNSNDVVTRVPFKITGFWRYYHVANKLQIGKRDGWKRYFPWNYKKWIEEDVDHNPVSYHENLIKYFQ